MKFLSSGSEFGSLRQTASKTLSQNLSLIDSSPQRPPPQQILLPLPPTFPKIRANALEKGDRCRVG